MAEIVEEVEASSSAGADVGSYDRPVSFRKLGIGGFLLLGRRGDCDTTDAGAELEVC